MRMALALLGLAWFGVTAALLFGRRAVLAALWREPVLGVPVLIVESDDWGVGPTSDALALRRIAALLRETRDGTGHPAVMTLGIVTGSPDGPAILAGGCRDYRRSTLLESHYAPILEAMREGCAQRVFALQRHGLEHCWPDALLVRARREGRHGTLARWLADPEARSEALPAELQSRWIDAAELPSRPLPGQVVAAVVDEEAQLLAQLFGRAPSVAVPNTFVWDDAVEQAWAASGVTCVVTPGCRHEGRDTQGRLLPASRVLRNGQRNAQGLCFVVRDVYFEPGRGHRAEAVWQAVAARTALGRPTLLETHRANFIGGEAELERALGELARALKGVLARHSDVRFMSTEDLARLLTAPDSVLLLHAPAQRLAVFLKRLVTARELCRMLRWSGLGIVAAGLSAALLAAARPRMPRPS